MEEEYIDVPLFTTINDIFLNNYTLSSTQYKKLCIKNDNLHCLSEFLDRELVRSDLGQEVGSNNYVDFSQYMFIKTKALQAKSFLIDDGKETIQKISPNYFVNMNLKKGDILMSKDSNVGEAVILDKDYPDTMLCGGIYRLPITKNKYYILAFIKSSIFRKQIDFLVPRGSTIRHGKKKFLECLIPLPKNRINITIKYVEILTKAIINKEIMIHKRYKEAMQLIEEELKSNQRQISFQFELPNINKILEMDRMDSSLYSKNFKEKEFLIINYKYGLSTIKELGFSPSRGQNLQVSNIGKSIQTSEYKEGYYTLILPKYLSKYGTVHTKEYLGNSNTLKTLKKGEIIFGAEGNEKGRSLVIIEEQENTITNIHGITFTQSNHNIRKGIFVKLFLDYYRSKGMIDMYAVGGNGGSLAIKYWDYIKFPNFPIEKEREVSLFYYSETKYNSSKYNLENFEKYDEDFNCKAGIYELDKSIKYLQQKLEKAIKNIINDEVVDTIF